MASEQEDGTRQPGPTEPPNTDLLDRRISHALQEMGVGPELLDAIKRFGGGGNGTGGEKLEPRVAKLEADVGHILTSVGDLKTDLRALRDTDIKGVREHAERDFRILFGAIITAALGLAGLIAKGFHWI